LVGNKTNDDAAVYDLGNEQCLISTTDFFMPVVDSPYDFGRVAATNAISDVYAMGGKPILAIAILGWPTEKLGTTSAKEVLNGAREICAKAGIPLAGGHSIESIEPIFGLAVNGLVERKNLKKNNSVKEGDSIYLTKSIGTGIYSTAMKRGVLKPEDQSVLVNSMCELNSIGAELGKLPYVNAITDVTGFGFLGHLLEMIGDKNLTAEIEKKKIKTFENLNFYTSQFIFPDNTTRNFNAYEKDSKGMIDLEFMTYCDPQTSGGLLFTINSANEIEFEKWLKEKNSPAVKIGTIMKSGEKKVEFV
jgi:selenide,water dikinase